MASKMERLCRWAWSNPVRALKQKVFPAVARGGSQRVAKREKNLMCCSWCWGWRRMRRNMDSSKEPWSPWPAKKQEFQSFNHKQLNSAYKISALGSIFFPRASTQEPRQADIVISILWDSVFNSASKLQDYNIIGYCFKPLNLWSFVMNQWKSI